MTVLERMISSAVIEETYKSQTAPMIFKRLRLALGDPLVGSAGS
jgi:hypothetical protein